MVCWKIRCVNTARKKDSVETLGVDLRTRIKRLGAKEQARKRSAKYLEYKEEQGLPKEQHEGGRQKVVLDGHGASKDLGSPCSGDGSHGKVDIEETDGSSSRQKEHDFTVLVHGDMWPRSGRRALHHGHSVLGGVWRRKWPAEQKEARMKQIQEVQSWKQVRGPAGAVIAMAYLDI